MRNLFLLFFLMFLVRSYGQDMLSRQAPIDRKMKYIDSISLKNLYNDNEQPDKVYKKENTIIVDDKSGWEWIYNEEYTFHDDSYPHRISYRKYVNHPQYTVVGNNVYNKSYAIVRVEENNFENVEFELLRYVYIKDYKSNKYNFSKENTKAQNYVKKQLRILPQDFYGYSEPGALFLEQLEKDHKNDFDNLLKCERLSNLSFKLTYGNKLKEPTKTYKVTYTNKGAYTYGITISELPLEKIDWAKYENMISSNKGDNKNDDSSNYLSNEGLHLYKVKKGDTLPSIARKCNTTVENLCKINHIGKNVRLMPGQILKFDLSASNISSTDENEEDYANLYEVEEQSRFSNEEGVSDVDINKVYDVVEEMPQFPGGPSALFEFISRNMQYPVVAEENGVQGRVICTYVIESDGSISDIKVVKSVDPSLDKEAVRVVSSMPKWIPGKQKGIPVRVKYTVPVTFRLQ